MTVRLTSQLLRSPRVQRSAPVAVEIAYRRWLSWGKFRSVIPRSRMQYSVSGTVGRLATCTALVESLEIHVNFSARCSSGGVEINTLHHCVGTPMPLRVARMSPGLPQRESLAITGQLWPDCGAEL